MHRARLVSHGAFNVAVAVLDNRTSEWRGRGGAGGHPGPGPRGGHRGRGTPPPPRAAPPPLPPSPALPRGRTRPPPPPRRPRPFPDRGGGRPLPAPQLRRPLPRAAARAGGPGRVRERTGGVAALAHGRARSAPRPAPRRPEHPRQDPRLLRLRAHHGRRGG